MKLLRKFALAVVIFKIQLKEKSELGKCKPAAPVLFPPQSKDYSFFSHNKSSPQRFQKRTLKCCRKSNSVEYNVAAVKDHPQ